MKKFTSLFLSTIFIIIALSSPLAGRTIAAKGFISKISSPNFILLVRMNLVPGFSVIGKFAENPSIQTSTTAEIWDFGDVEPVYTYSTSAAIDSISSSNAGDTNLISIEGVDGSGDVVKQTINLTGQTRLPIIPLFRVYRVFNANGVLILGDVYVYENTALSGGVPIDTTKVRAFVSTEEQQTLMSPYTVPRGFTAFFLGLTASISKQPSASNVIFTGTVRPFGGVFRTQIRFNLSSTGTSNEQQLATAFSPFPERSDFSARAIVSTNNTGASVSYSLLLINNDLLPDDIFD